MKRINSILLLALLVLALPSYGQGLKAFKLKNGLSVYIWEDSTKTDVFGLVGVRAGSINEPVEYTGLAHYLEHVLFKGTDQIGSLDWNQEKPIYDEIIAKYDQRAAETDPAKRAAIDQEINDLTLKAGNISLPTEYSNLMESIGAQGVNAGTTYDFTYYHSSFPPYQINKWLEISSQRFINPVFRSFQPELENVYEEYNRSQDNSGQAIGSFLMEKAFEGHPYSRDIIGLPEHLKNPQLSKLIDFYNTWYVPENMVLVLAGNINAQKAAAHIAASFGRLQKKPLPERKTYPENLIKGHKQYTAKIGQYPQVAMIFNGVSAGHPDENALDIALSLLSNSSQTGALDKLTLDGELTSAGAYAQTFRERGRSIIVGIPLYDENQRRWESNKSVEKKSKEAITKIANGEFEDWKIDAVKAEMCRDYELAMESNEQIAMILLDAFINEKDLNEVLNYKDKILAVTPDDVKRVAKQYLSDNYISLYIEQGKPQKDNKIQKPNYKPVDPPVGKESLYATQFKNMPIGHMAEKFIDFSDVQVKQLNDRSKMYYTANKENNIFQLVLQYGAGTNEFPKLDVAATLMNNAGVMGLYEPQQLKEELSKLNATCYVTANSNYMTIVMEGFDQTLPQVCQLLSRQILMPKLDDKQLNQIKGSILGSRQQRKEDVSTLNEALRQYMLYGDKSDFIDELTDKEVLELQISELTGDINRASNFECKIYYSGTLPFDNAYDILSKNLPLVANERPTQSPQVKPMQAIQENTIYFLPNNEAEQAQIHFYLPMETADKKDDVIRAAFNQYFGLDFTGLVLHEIREKRSMAYTAYAYATTQGIAGKASYLYGSIGTQNDKANDALDVFMGLINDMPENADRIDNIKNYLRQSVLTNHPDFRSKAMYMVNLGYQGYTEDPAKEQLPQIDALTFDDIVKFYKEHIKGKPYCIAIMGNPKMIDIKKLEKYGKVIRLSESKLFNNEDSLF